jgi:hypothetical protein
MTVRIQMVQSGKVLAEETVTVEAGLTDGKSNSRAMMQTTLPFRGQEAVISEVMPDGTLRRLYTGR